MESGGDTLRAQAGHGPSLACPRCGDFAEVHEQLDRSMCILCWQRIDLGVVSYRGVLADVGRLAGTLLLPAWLALVAVELPLILGGATYVWSAGEDLPLWFGALYQYITLVAVGAILHASHQVLMADSEIRWSTAWRASSARWAAVVVASWLSSVITLMFGLLLVVPGVLRLLSYAIAVPIALHEGKDAEWDLSQSRARTQGHRWKILCVIAGLFIAGYSMVVLASVLLILLAGSEAGELSMSLHIALTILVDVVIQLPTALICFASASLYVRCTAQLTAGSLQEQNPAAAAG